MRSPRPVALRLALALVGLVALVALPALAPPARAESPYRTRAAIDLPVTGLGLVLTLPAFLEVRPPACLPDCDPADVNAFDRPIIGNYSAPARTAADVTVVAMVVLPLLLDAIDSGGDGWLDDSAVYAETLAVMAGLTQLTKAAVDRAAPFVYDPNVPDDVRRNDRDGPRSFFSGHTSMAFAAAAATTVTFWQRHPKSGWRWVVLGVSAAVATSVGLFKIEAGYHWWSDVIAGAVAGTSVGILVPVLHFR
ncbi:MAG: phosphatase PAP2 family protein [Myxococcota bacterium]